MIPFRRYANNGDQNVPLDQVQDSIEATLAPILASVVVDSHVVGPIAFVSGSATKVDHRLGRKVQGWIVVGKDAVADLFQSPSKSPHLQLTLTSTADVNASFLVF